MADTMAAVCEAQMAETRRLCADTLDHYAKLLRERAERDRAFKAARGWEGEGSTPTDLAQDASSPGLFRGSPGEGAPSAREPRDKSGDDV